LELDIEQLHIEELHIEELHIEELGNRFSATANAAVKPG
jgi:hypothetical protein